MDSVRIAVSVTVLIGSTVLLVVPCEGQNAPASPYPSGVVVAQSRYGNGSIRAAVRRAGLGWKVQLPGGRWVYCRRSCAETLRAETVDFFETNAAGSGNSRTSAASLAALISNTRDNRYLLRGGKLTFPTSSETGNGESDERIRAWSIPWPALGRASHHRNCALAIASHRRQRTSFGVCRGGSTRPRVRRGHSRQWGRCRIGRHGNLI
jgi:hypothetical protein